MREWIELTDSRAAMLVARDGFALWGRASDAAYESGIFIRQGMPISDGSIVAIGSGAQNAKSNRPIALPAEIWNFSRGSEPVRELTIFSERLGMAVSLLQFHKHSYVADVEKQELWDADDQFAAGGQS